MEDLIGLYDGRVLVVHSPMQCRGSICCIHAPSDHHMATWRQSWNGEARIMERVCPHFIAHPDPDDDWVRVNGWLVDGHPCDGCCWPR